MVASGPRPARSARSKQVSIPFIAGQWSLPAFAVWRAQREAAVSIPFIAGQWSLPDADGAAGVGRGGVSIPFIAGQWSLRGAMTDNNNGRRTSQSPSLRGSGRFLLNAITQSRPSYRLNPLHCGAVVASRRSAGRRRWRRWVSIPFIAGQWSLPPRTTPFPFCRVLLPNTRPACDHVLCARLHVWPKPVIIP